MDDVRENDQCLFFVGVTIILMAESKKELEIVCETVETIGNRKKLINGNGFVFGVPGSGKSFFCKMEMTCYTNVVTGVANKI
jgi:hypothetical protein